MKIGIACEGLLDYKVIKSVTKKIVRSNIEIHPEIISKTTNLTSQKLHILEILIRESNLDICIVHHDRDRNRTVIKKLEAWARESSQNIILALPKPHTEQWLIQDTRAINRVCTNYDNNILANNRIDPKSKLDHLFENSLKSAELSYGKNEFIEDLCNEIDFSLLENHDRTFKKFKSAILNKVRTI